MMPPAAGPGMTPLLPGVPPAAAGMTSGAAGGGSLMPPPAPLGVPPSSAGLGLPPAPPTGFSGAPPPPIPPPIPPPAPGSQPGGTAAMLNDMMSIMMQLTRPEKHIQPAEPDRSIPPVRTLYINNLNDKINADKIKEELRVVFEPYGEVVDIVAMKSFWRRGQAYVSFKDQNAASRAMQELQGAALKGKPMRINFARQESDCLRRAEGAVIERPKGPKKPRAIREREERLQEQLQQIQRRLTGQGMQGLMPPVVPPVPPPVVGPMEIPPAPGALTEDLSQRRKAFTMSLTEPRAEPEAKRAKLDIPPPTIPPAPGAAELGPGGIPPAPAAAPGVAAGAGAAAAASGAGVPVHGKIPGPPVMPNRILFIEHLPPDCQEAEVVALFEALEGFERVRLIAPKQVAFVDFKTAGNAAVAMSATRSKEVRDSHPLHASFAKR